MKLCFVGKGSLKHLHTVRAKGLLQRRLLFLYLI
jgi:hypothetical protein